MPKSAPPIPDPNSQIRWLALLPDPVTGLDAPVRDADGRPVVIHAPDRDTARGAAKLLLRRAQYRLCGIVALVDWESRTAPQRAKLLGEEGESRGAANPRQRCWRCGGTTPTRLSRYCNRCRRRRHSAASLAPATADAAGA